MTTKERVIEAIENMNEEQLSFLDKILPINKYSTKIDLLKIFAPEMDTNMIDSAYPQTYYDRIKEIYPDMENGIFIFDYNKNELFGNLVNVNNIIANKLISFLSSLH